MKLFVNGRFLTQENSGVQLYAKEICKELLAAHDDIRILVPKNQPVIDAQFNKYLTKIGKLKGHLWEQINLQLFIQKHPEAYLLNFCNTAPAFANNQAVTIHDLAFIKNPKWFNPVFSKIYTRLIPKLLRNSKYIITVSNAIKQEIYDTYKTDPYKITVIGNKVPQKLLEAHPHSPFKEDIGNFYLMVGTNNPRKNFTFVEEIFAASKGTAKLVVVGGTHRAFNTAELQKRVSENIIRIPKAMNSELRWLYENAKAFINPSLYEGFGIPNIEAMAFNCPIICSDIPVFTEVCRDAAFYFKLGDVSSFQNCLSEVATNTALVKKKKEAAKIISDEYQHQNRAELILTMLSK